MVFKDSQIFMNHLQWIFENQKNPQLIINKNKSLGLKSMTEYYNEGMKMEEDDPEFIEYVKNYPYVFYQVPFDESILYELPHSISLCYIANKDGIFQIGKKIMRIAWQQIYTINDGDESKIDMLFLPKDEIHDKSISVTPSVLETKNDYGVATRLFSDHRFRIVGKLIEYIMYVEHWGWVWMDDVQTIAQKRTLGLWFRAKLNTKTANNDGYSACTGCDPIDIDAGDEEGDWETRYSIVCGSIDQIDMAESYCPVYHRGRYNYQYIYIYWADALDATPVADVELTSPPF